jgi:transcriptional regulator with GAF, ATPase, and Fis domain
MSSHDVEQAGIGRARVIVWDHDPDRARLVANSVASCDAEILCPQRLEAIQFPQSIRIALVAIGEPPSASALTAIQQLVERGAHVIAYADQADTWPVGVRCRAHLAGACALFDASSTRFSSDLHARVTHTLAVEHARRRERDALRRAFREQGIVGESDAMLAIFRWVLRISALSDLHVLITGETGTGKQLLAEAIHRLDPKRRDGPFIALNCGAISPGLAESELFGHRRGAFTGADRDRKGLIRAAQGGVLFLDEIGELDLALQAKVLRVLQEGRVLGLGDDHEVQVSVRIVAATNRDLEEMVGRRAFRADLFHRLNVLSVHMPPLRERATDIGPLVGYFAAKYFALRGQSPVPVGDEFVEALMQDELSGNARQLENIVRRAIVQKDDEGPLGLADLPPEIWAHVSQHSVGAAQPASLSEHSHLKEVLTLSGWNLARALATCERSLVEVALHAANGNQSQTARLLGITPRSVYNKIRKHQL